MKLRSEETRLRTLRATGLLDSPPEKAFDRLSRLAAGLLGAPVALVSLVDERRQFFKAALGLSQPWASRRETPLTHSFCRLAVADRAPLVVSDAREHPRLRDNLAIRDLNVIAYAGIPLVVDDEAIGAFCVVDDKPRQWSREDMQLLQDLADSVTSEIELRLVMRRDSARLAMLDALLESIGEGVLAMDPEGKIIVANNAARHSFAQGIQVGESLSPEWVKTHQSLRPDGTPIRAHDGALYRAMRGEKTDGLSFTLQKSPEDEPIWVEASGRPVRDPSGALVAGIAVYRDVTQKVRDAEIVSTLVRNLPRAAVAVFDRELRCLTIDGGLIRGGAVPIEAMIGKPMSVITALPPNDPRLERIDAMYRGVIEGREGTADYTHENRVYELSAAPVRDALGRVNAGIVLAFDRTEVRRLEESVARDRTLLSAALEHMEDAVVLLDSGEHKIILANQAYSKMFGISAELEGMNREKFLAHLLTLVDDPDTFLPRLMANLTTVCDFELARPRRRVLRRAQTPVKLPLGEAFLVTWHDVTSEHDLLAERERQLVVDALTGIANRRGAEAVLDVEDARRARTGQPFCVALFDVDHFKRVNDVHGHANGDEVLREVAATLAGQARLTDFVARWGGEEFLAVLPGALEGGEVFAERVRAAVARLALPGVGTISISAGVAEVAAGETPEAAIARADERLYDAKREGRNRVAS